MENRIKKLFIACLFCLFVTDITNANLAKRIDAVIARPTNKKVQFSVNIIKADTGQTVYSHNPRKPLIPASNMKIITTAAALRYLGPDYKYKTIVGLSGKTLIVIGSGDPLLGDEKTDAKYSRQKGWIFDDIIKKLKQNGVKTIDDIIVDTTVFDDNRVNPNWPKTQLNQWYACEVSGLNYNRNCVTMTVKNVGGKAKVFIEPRTNYINITNKVKVISKGKSAVGAYRQPGKPNNLLVRGKCKKQQGPFEVAIERPAAFFGYMLAEKLRKAGIDITGRFIEKQVATDQNFKQLTQYETSIKDCLARCNKNSLGLAAEALLKTLSSNRQGGGSWQAGGRMMSRYLRQIGADDSEFNIDDGSGLSRQNKLSANTLTKVLLDMYTGDNWHLFKHSLAVGGTDGTIRKYFKDKKYKGRIFGKTGFINGVKSFSGICSTDNGDYIFSILTNNANGRTRPAINDIAKAIFE